MVGWRWTRILPTVRHLGRRLTQLSSAEQMRRMSLIAEHTTVTEVFGMKLHLITEENEIFFCQDEETLPFESPFWGFLWPGGLGLTRYIHENPSKFRDKSVLDIGSGCGSSSIAALAAGASRVVANDICPFARDALSMNLKLNGYSESSVEVHSEDKLGKKREYFDEFDVVICGDMLYNEELASRLLPALQHHRMAIVGDPQRVYCPDIDSSFEVLADFDFGKDGFPR